MESGLAFFVCVFASLVLQSNAVQQCVMNNQGSEMEVGKISSNIDTIKSKDPQRLLACRPPFPVYSLRCVISEKWSTVLLSLRSA